MKRSGEYFLLMIIFLSLSSSLWGWGKKNDGDFLQPGRRTAGSLILDGDQISYSYRTFKVRVPDNVFRMEVKIDHSPADLDIYINQGREITDYDEADFASTKELYNEVFSLSRMSSTPLETGVYYIDVVYPLDRLPIINEKESTVIPFGITVRMLSFGYPERLRPGKTTISSLTERTAMFKLYSVDIPDNAETLRLDLFNTVSDLDMYVSFERFPFSSETADYVKEGYLGSESLVISRDSPRPLKTGRYYISVFDRIDDELTDSFSLLASFSPQVPEILTAYPELPDPKTDLERAVAATVELSTETGAGSGCLVSPEGDIITALHVIRTASGEIPDEVAVSMTLSPFDPPRELFRAKVMDVHEQEDLAYLQIFSGYYGQPLPAKYRFPFFKIGGANPEPLGEKLSFLGYPQIGGEGSRVSISLTRGIVSGYNRTDFGYLLKTDGEINSGNSGGAAFDGSYRLVGFPLSVISSEGGQIAYIYPAALVPSAWINRKED